MDPSALMNVDSFPNANAASYNLAEIWRLPINGAGVGDPGGGLGLRRPLFGQSLAPFGDVSVVNRDVSGNDPMSLDQRGNHGGARKRRDVVEDDSPKGVSTSSGNGVSDCDGKRLKTSGCKDENHESKAEAEPSAGKPAEQKARPPEPPKQDYIHVRARRGQATDSHSLAERARREKISERMKILQDLVPGCNKVIGKALVLDEIINYIQSLQRQVEFLSMKLEAVNSRMNPGIEVFPSKDVNLASQYGQQTFEAAGMAFGSQPARDFSRGSSPEWLHMQERVAQITRRSRIATNTMPPRLQTTSRSALTIESEANSRSPSTAKDTNWVDIAGGKTEREAFLARLEIFLTMLCRNLTNKSTLLSSVSSSSSPSSSVSSSSASSSPSKKKPSPALIPHASSLVELFSLLWRQMLILGFVRNGW